jgi:hypothetical protein
MEAAVKRPIMAWNTTRERLTLFYGTEIRSNPVVRTGSTHSPGGPIVGVGIVHIGDRIEIEGTVSCQEILAMLLGQMSDPILNVKGIPLAGLHGGRGSGGPLNMKGIAVGLVHWIREKRKGSSVGWEKEPVRTQLLIGPLLATRSRVRAQSSKPRVPRTFKSLGAGATEAYSSTPDRTLWEKWSKC